jgi:hypothetical protein
VLRETTSQGLCGLVCPSRTGTREEPGTLIQGAPVFPGSSRLGISRLGIEPKTPGWLVQDPTTRPIGDLIPTIGVRPVRNPVLEHSLRPVFPDPTTRPFGNRTQNSRVTGARPNHQADRGSDPNHQGIRSPPRAGLGPMRNPVI